jgi:hypothetical protein
VRRRGPDQPPRITPQTVAQVWRRIDLPPSPLVIEPPKGTTLVNFDTNF